MDASNPLSRLAAAPQSLPADTLRRLNEDYPYMPLAAMALLKYHHDSLSEDELNSLRMHLSLVCSDKTALFNILGDHAEAFFGIYPAAQAAEPISTDSAIDTFFANYGMADPSETALLERMIFNPVPDYSEILLAEAGEEDELPDFPSLPPQFEMQPKPKPVSAQHVEEPKPGLQPAAPASTGQEKAVQPDDGSLLSESLAKIFIKQGRYERAYEIISNLSLNYPKKSIYFADQLRFLQKLIKIKQAANGDKH